MTQSNNCLNRLFASLGTKIAHKNKFYDLNRRFESLKTRMIPLNKFADFTLYSKLHYKSLC